MNEVRIKESWELIMGKLISTRTDSLHLNKGTLTVRLNSAVLRQELMYRQDEILRSLNDHLEGNPISEIKFL